MGNESPTLLWTNFSDVFTSVEHWACCDITRLWLCLNRFSTALVFVRWGWEGTRVENDHMHSHFCCTCVEFDWQSGSQWRHAACRFSGTERSTIVYISRKEHSSVRADCSSRQLSPGAKHDNGTGLFNRRMRATAHWPAFLSLYPGTFLMLRRPFSIVKDCGWDEDFRSHSVSRD